MTNKYAATCKCGAKVRARAGTLLRNDANGWYVRCAGCMGSAASLAPILFAVQTDPFDRAVQDRYADSVGLSNYEERGY